MESRGRFLNMVLAHDSYTRLERFQNFHRRVRLGLGHELHFRRKLSRQSFDVFGDKGHGVFPALSMVAPSRSRVYF
jgi:hypothetical protein